MTLPVWVDRKATIKQFGYDPASLTTQSSKYIVRICQTCYVAKVVRMADGRKYCKLCFSSSQEHRKTMQILGDNHPKRVGNYNSQSIQPIPILQLVELYYAGGISIRNGCMVSLKSRNYNNKESVNILRYLELDLYTSTTSKLKAAILNKLHYSIDTSMAFTLMSYLLDTRFTLGFKKGQYLIQDRTKLLYELFNILNISYVFLGNSNRIVIKEGSFFIEGRWIHVTDGKVSIS